MHLFNTYTEAESPERLYIASTAAPPGYCHVCQRREIPDSWRFWQDSQIPKAIDMIPNRVGPLAKIAASLSGNVIVQKLKLFKQTPLVIVSFGSNLPF